MNEIIRFEEYDKNNIDIYYGDQSIGYIERKGKYWSWKFGHPINRKTYQASTEFIIDAKREIIGVFMAVKTDIEMKLEDQMTHLKGLHFLPIIEND